MLPFAYYLLKVIICSGILYGYYLLVLRNKIFHRWNRFYLLAAVVLSLVVPLIKINIFQNGDKPETQVIHLLQVVSTGDEFVYEYTKGGNFYIDASNFSLFIYIVVSGLLLGFLIQTLLKIRRLKKNNLQTIVEGINFINTNAEGTPFSFFNDIFWNDKIDLNTATGKQIFQHEVAHVQEKHSYDKIFLNIVLIVFWCNPFFWLMRKELNIIHEFIADKKALEDSDTAAFAAMILQATYPQQQFTITNNFFYSPLKRRLAMLTKNKNSKISYVSRLLALPLAALVFFAFTLKMKPINSPNQYTGKKITVVIDAGHGGDDNGVTVNNIKEKDLTLSIAKVIKEMNKNENINIILSREQDKYIHPKDRVIFSESSKADLFISIHIDAAFGSSKISGLNIMIPNNDNAYLTESKILGSSIIESFKNNYPLTVANEVMQRAKGVYILKANQYPSILIEAGFLTTPKDLAFLIQSENQKTIARNILNGIERYALQATQSKKVFQNAKADAQITNEATSLKKEKQVSHSNDSIPQYYIGKKIKGAQGMNNGKNHITYTDGTKDTIPTTQAESTRIIPPPPAEIIRNGIAKNTDKVFTKVEVPPSFPGGDMVWSRYIKKIIEKHISELSTDNKSGTCRIRFIVDTQGNVSNVEALTMKGTKLGEVAIDAIRKGPKWVPAKQNGNTVNAYREQAITFTIAPN